MIKYFQLKSNSGAIKGLFILLFYTLLTTVVWLAYDIVSPGFNFDLENLNFETISYLY